jgi:hypothetical protein
MKDNNWKTKTNVWSAVARAQKGSATAETKPEIY